MEKQIMKRIKSLMNERNDLFQPVPFGGERCSRAMMMPDDDNAQEERTVTVRIWTRIAQVLYTLVGKSLTTGESFIIEIPDYLDKPDKGDK